jgi:hypothetical protein
MTDAELPDDAQAPSDPRPGPPHPEPDGRSRSIWGLPAPAPVEEREDARPVNGLPRRKPGTSLAGMPDDLRKPVPPDPEAARRLLAALTEEPRPEPPPRHGRHSDGPSYP